MRKVKEKRRSKRQPFIITGTLLCNAPRRQAKLKGVMVRSNGGAIGLGFYPIIIVGS